jgi:hypothetical protein
MIKVIERKNKDNRKELRFKHNHPNRWRILKYSCDLYVPEYHRGFWIFKYWCSKTLLDGGIGHDPQPYWNKAIFCTEKEAQNFIDKCLGLIKNEIL